MAGDYIFVKQELLKNILDGEIELRRRINGISRFVVKEEVSIRFLSKPGEGQLKSGGLTIPDGVEPSPDKSSTG